MIGYTDAIIERQDRYDILKRVESFDVETKTRRVMGELVEHFQGQINKTLKNCEKQTKLINQVNEKFKNSERTIKQLMQGCSKIPAIEEKHANLSDGTKA